MWISKPESTAPWATATTNKVEPTAEKKGRGWEHGEKPVASSYFNWWQHLVHRWLSWLSERLLEDRTEKTLELRASDCDPGVDQTGDALILSAGAATGKAGSAIELRAAREGTVSGDGGNPPKTALRIDADGDASFDGSVSSGGRVFGGAGVEGRSYNLYGVHGVVRGPYTGAGVRGEGVYGTGVEAVGGQNAHGLEVSVGDSNSQYAPLRVVPPKLEPAMPVIGSVTCRESGKFVLGNGTDWDRVMCRSYVASGPREVVNHFDAHESRMRYTIPARMLGVGTTIHIIASVDVSASAIPAGAEIIASLYLGANVLADMLFTKDTSSRFFVDCTLTLRELHGSVGAWMMSGIMSSHDGGAIVGGKWLDSGPGADKDLRVGLRAKCNLPSQSHTVTFETLLVDVQ